MATNQSALQNICDSLLWPCSWATPYIKATGMALIPSHFPFKIISMKYTKAQCLEVDSSIALSYRVSQIEKRASDFLCISIPITLALQSTTQKGKECHSPTNATFPTFGPLYCSHFIGEETRLVMQGHCYEWELAFKPSSSILDFVPPSL